MPQDPESLSAKPERATSAIDVPLIFVSHDSRDADLGELFSKLLKDVSAGVLKSFLSSDRKGSQGIEFGVDWYPHIMEKLKNASDVVCLLTKNSLNRPWILYEAGVSKGRHDTPVHGIAFGIPLAEAATGPFAQFQNCADDVDSLTKLVMQLLRRVPGADPDREAIGMQVSAFKSKADEVLKRQPLAQQTANKAASVDDPSVAKLFEEIKVMFRDLPERLDAQLGPRIAHREAHRRRTDPHLMEALALHMNRFQREEGIGMLVVASMLRDDFPWLYDLGRDVYFALKTASPKELDTPLSYSTLRVTHVSVSPPASRILYCCTLHSDLHTTSWSIDSPALSQRSKVTPRRSVDAAASSRLPATVGPIHA